MINKLPKGPVGRECRNDNDLKEEARQRLLGRVQRLEKAVRTLRGMVTSLFVCIAIMFGMRIWEIEQATPVAQEPIRPTADAALVAAHYSRALP